MDEVRALDMAFTMLFTVSDIRVLPLVVSPRRAWSPTISSLLAPSLPPSSPLPHPPHSMVTHKRLKEIAGAQQSEMNALADELDKLRLRTYPTFVEPSLGGLPPDTKASLWRA